MEKQEVNGKGGAAVLGVSPKKFWQLKATRPDFPKGIVYGPRCVRYSLPALIAWKERQREQAQPPRESERLARGRASFWALPPDKREERKVQNALARAAREAKRAAKEAARLAALEAAERALGGKSGRVGQGAANPTSEGARAARARAEKESVEPKTAGNSNPREAAGK